MPFRSWSGRFATVGAPILALGLSGLAACAPDLGPAAQVRPIADYASARSIALVAAPVAAWPAEDWWRVYNDPQLTTLIEQALKDSPDLKAVQARVHEAQAQADQARAVLGPTASAKGSVQATGVKLNFPNTPQQIQDLLPTSIQPFTQVSANLTYQLDFFGRNHAAVAAASSTAQASAFELAAARLQLSTAVASAYATLIQATADNVAANDDAKLRDDTRVLVADRVKNGLETRAESSQSDAALASSYVDRQQALAAVLHARYELAALIGAGPDATMDLKPDLTITPTPVGLPADAGANLIGRRPDIAAARLRVEAAAQKEKVARADFYPNFSLTGSLLAVSVTPQDILSRNLEMAQFGPALSLPLFDSGRLAGALRGARGDYEEAVANYDNAVVAAVRDMIDAVTMRQGILVSLVRAREAVAANQEAYRLVNLRYTGGLAPYLSVLTVQNTLVASRRQLADLQAKALIADVTLVRALWAAASKTRLRPLINPIRKDALMADDLAGSAAVSETGTPPGKTAAQTGRQQQRQRLFALLGGVGAVLIVLFALWWLLVASHYASTDDAYVGAEAAQITPLVGGAVKAVHVAETQTVKAGDVLVELDPADATLAAARAEADYQGALRKLKGDTATAGALSAEVSAKAADVNHAQAEAAVMASNVAKAKVDYDRRQALASTGAVSGEELTNAKAAYDNAQSNLLAAQAAAAQAVAGVKASQSQLAAQQAMIEGAVDTNPQVAAARAARDAATLDLQRTVIRSPIDGVVSKRTVQLGQRVQVGAPLMSVVPTRQLFVDANFKEVQLRKVRIGQTATLESDLYGGGVKYHGRVIGIGGGTGSAFSLIPAQNATGNWIKVVQRLPVRIQLDSDDLASHPLRLGLSMKAKIDLSSGGQPQAGG